MHTDRRRLLLSAPLACLAPAALRDAQDEEVAPPASAVVLVRHAEAAADTRDGGDPDLSEAGRARAEALRDLLAAAGVTHLFASEYRRTAATVEPLARALGLEVHAHPARDAEGLVRALSELPPGSRAVVAGHSNTVPDLLGRLGGRRGLTIEHADHARLFLVVGPRPGASASLDLELRVGD